MSTGNNLEDRIAALERQNKKIVDFCARLMGMIHKLDKNMAVNLGQIAEAIKEPERFDLDDYKMQIARAQFHFDQMDCHLHDANNPSPSQDGQ